MERNLIFVLLSLFLSSSGIKAQDNDFGMWYEAAVEKKLSKKWSVTGETEYRLRDNLSTTDRWSVALGGSYKLMKNLKLSGGYVFLYDNRAENLDLKSDGLTPNKWTPSYWGVRHRVNLSLTGSVDWQRFSVSLRERWQYTYRPEVTGKRYDIDEDAWIRIKGKAKHVLRSRLQVDYDIPHWKFDPYVSMELFNAKGGLQKMRYAVGTEYKLRKKHTFGVNYMFQDVMDDDDDMVAGRHILGLSYKYKF